MCRYSRDDLPNMTKKMLQMHNYHINIAINGIFKRQVRSVGNVHIVLTEERGRKTIFLKTYSNTQHPT
ncbi:hypothetical protein T12_7980 [Trichinella patagoniensis]|uniref:Uncharacterized protein n=1 Tax=Trichinella patagoniensis TaxID=990121 RepID=A0A0V0ZU45_9BILA|nr:hypothetical protein T12_7980 [Trichinella patagoniensis]